MCRAWVCVIVSHQVKGLSLAFDLAGWVDAR